MAAEHRSPVYIDTTKASIARVYDAFLGGKDNYEVDREVFHRVKQVAPEAATLAVDNRQFLIRVSRYVAARTGIKQFIDCGSGLPTAENTHQVVHRVEPDATVVYVDNDPVVLAHGRALLEKNERTHFIAEDIFDPETLLANEVLRAHIDFAEPVAVFQLGTIHHYGGRRPVPDIMRAYLDVLPPGSVLAISHFCDPQDGGELSELARRMEDVFLHSPMGSGWFRTRAEIAAMFCDLEMVAPGVSICARWWPDAPLLRGLPAVSHCIAGGIGVKR